MGDYTRGPWTIAVSEEYEASWFEVRGSADGDGWATVVADLIALDADARLIAAAPDLLEAAKLAEQQLIRLGFDGSASGLTAAIAKAEGQP